MSQIVLSDNFMSAAIKALIDNNWTFDVLTFNTFKNDIIPDGSSDTTQFEATTYAGGATTATFTFNGPAKNQDGEYHLIDLSGIDRSNSDTVSSGLIYGYWVKVDTADADSAWFAERFDEAINLPIGGLLNISPELRFPLINGQASVER